MGFFLICVVVSIVLFSFDESASIACATSHHWVWIISTHTHSICISAWWCECVWLWLCIYDHVWWAKSSRNNSFSWVCEKIPAAKILENKAKKKSSTKETQKINIGMWSVLFALLAIMLDYLFFSFSVSPLIFCALHSQFIAYTWEMKKK